MYFKILHFPGLLRSFYDDHHTSSLVESDEKLHFSKMLIIMSLENSSLVVAFSREFA